MLDHVAGIIQEVSAEVLEPRFAALGELNAWHKAPGEVVTSGDIEAERLLIRRLAELAPGVPVLGEEAAAADPSLPAALANAPRLWLVDPLDGTANFVAGSPDWAIMVALLEHGTTVASWIWRPVGRRLFVAERGGGAWAGDRRIVCPTPPTDIGALAGSVLTRFLGDDVRSSVAANAQYFAQVTDGRMCAGVEYPMIAEGDQHFAFFGRTLSWDHAPGVLLVEEAGGWPRRLDDSGYRPAQTSFGLLVAADEHTWIAVRDHLLGNADHGRR